MTPFFAANLACQWAHGVTVFVAMVLWQFNTNQTCAHIVFKRISSLSSR